MSNFQLTPTTKHYVNANGDRCEAALLNGVWVAAWGFLDANGNRMVSTHFTDGRLLKTCYRMMHFDYDITAEFTGWLESPQSAFNQHAHFNSAPKTWEYASVFYEGEYDSLAIQFHQEKPTESPDDFMWDSKDCWWVYLTNSEIKEFYSLPEDVMRLTDDFDWRNSLTCREDWQ